MSDEDDWFARALREDDGESDDADRDGRGEVDAEDTGGDDESEVDTDDEGAGDGDGSEDTAEGDEVPFEEDFASALGEAPAPEEGDVTGGGPAGPGGPGGEADDFGGFEGFGGETGGGFGEGAAGGFGGETFDDAELDSDIGRIKLGVEGLDEMILGGVPERSLIAAIGSAGTGKTTFGLQFLERALSQDERGVYITLEETRERVIRTADEKGWAFSDHADAERLAVVGLDPIEMANNLSSIRSDLPDLIRDFGASRLVLDSVSLLEMMYDHPSRRRSEVFEFTRALKSAGVTTLVTSEASEDSPYASRYGIIEYLADAVFVLQYVRGSDFHETRLALEIQKIRDANHSRETKPYEITDEGMSVYRQANIF